MSNPSERVTEVTLLPSGMPDDFNDKDAFALKVCWRGEPFKGGDA